MKSTTMLAMAFHAAQDSKCVSYKVGAIISKTGDDHLLVGYNGTVAGQPNCDEVALSNGWAEYIDVNGSKVAMLREDKSDLYSDWAKHNVIHAEMNAIIRAAKKTGGIEGSTMYCTLSPCPDCAKAIAQSGIRTLVYCDEYNGSSKDWVEILTNSNVKVIKIDRKHLKIDFNTIKSKLPRIE